MAWLWWWLLLAEVAEGGDDVLIEGLVVGDVGLLAIVGVLELHTGELVEGPAERGADLIPRHLVVHARLLHRLLRVGVEAHDVPQHPGCLVKRAHLVVC